MQLHVYNVSPALTAIERQTAKSLANLFGFNGPRAGGVTCQGGSSSNLTSIVTARNTSFPETKLNGNGTHNLVVFTSQNGHYSVEKAATTLGLGKAAVILAPVDKAGCLVPSALREAVIQAKRDGKTPFYVNATPGTTVLGSFDPFRAISEVCKEFNLWLHVDGSWGGSVVFSSAQRHKLDAVELADSITVNPHQMLNVPVTLAAGYLFHGDEDGEAEEEDKEYWDLADLTLQCGRRGDALKLALAWVYYGASGFEERIDNAFAMASYLAALIEQHPDFKLTSTNPPPCLQVCFYHAPGGALADDPKENTRQTSEMVKKLVPMGFMIDYSPGPQVRPVPVYQLSALHRRRRRRRVRRAGRLMDWSYRRITARYGTGGDGRLEFRVPYLVPGVMITPLGLFLYGWAAQYVLAWPAVDIGATFFTLGSFVSSQMLYAYQLDEFVEYGA
ncbi:hypothetical protein diail_2868 [Diaporthe ilicicola]|nr:hypothetical protein diail_2868 [Diaporthe ilicicola]